jgi:hypothetical protein
MKVPAASGLTTRGAVEGTAVVRSFLSPSDTFVV